MQLELTLSRRTDPPTSRQAAQRAVEFMAGHESLIWGALLAGEYTAKEMAQITRLTDVQINRRLKGMADRRLIERTGQVREGCAVWRKR